MVYCQPAELNLKTIYFNQKRIFLKSALNISLPDHKSLVIWKNPGNLSQIEDPTRRYTYPSCHFDLNGWHEKDFAFESFIREALCKFLLGLFSKYNFVCGLLTKKML